MKKKLLGKTGLIVSEIAFGGVEIGMPYGIGVNSDEDLIQQGAAIELLHEALDAGINFFDTARLYGESESIMGKAFAGRRDQVVINSKCKRFNNDDGSIPGYNQLKKIIEESLSESLAALQTDYLDVFMLHQADKAILENEDVAKIFTELKKSGVIRATGVSTYTPEETCLAINAGVWDAVQLPFNLLDQRQFAYFELAAANGIGIIIRSVLLKGLLSDKGINLSAPLKKVEDHIKQFTSLPGQSLSSLPTLATRFALSFDEVSAVLVGIDRLEYLYQTLQAANEGSLDVQTKKRLREMGYPEPDFLNLHTWSVKGWLK